MSPHRCASIGIPLAVLGWILGVFTEHPIIGMTLIIAPFYVFKMFGWVDGHPFDFMWKRGEK